MVEFIFYILIATEMTWQAAMIYEGKLGCLDYKIINYRKESKLLFFYQTNKMQINTQP